MRWSAHQISHLQMRTIVRAHARAQSRSCLMVPDTVLGQAIFYRGRRVLPWAFYRGCPRGTHGRKGLALTVRTLPLMPNPIFCENEQRSSTIVCYQSFTFVIFLQYRHRYWTVLSNTASCSHRASPPVPTARLPLRPPRRAAQQSASAMAMLSRLPVNLGRVASRLGAPAAPRVAHTSGLAAALHAASDRPSATTTALARAPPSAIVRHAHSSSARDAVNMGLKGMAPKSGGEYVVTKLDDRTCSKLFGRGGSSGTRRAPCCLLSVIYELLTLCCFYALPYCACCVLS